MPLPAERGLLAPAIAAAGVCFALAQWTDSFEVLVAFEAAALLLAISLYARLALRAEYPGARTVTAGLALTGIAAVAQSSSLTLTLIVPFDHNGIFHLIQIAALPLLARGLLAGFRVGAARV